MTCPFDRAQETEAMFLRHALEAQRARGGQPVGDWHVLSALDCQDPTCDEPIPDARRQAMPGVQLCTACQELAEKAKKPR